VKAGQALCGLTDNWTKGKTDGQTDGEGKNNMSYVSLKIVCDNSDFRMVMCRNIVLVLKLFVLLPERLDILTDKMSCPLLPMFPRFSCNDYSHLAITMQVAAKTQSVQ
jgi:hypothetical protein